MQMHNIGDENKMEKIFDRPHSLSDVVLSYCPGCTHGVINRLIAEISENEIHIAANTETLYGLTGI